MKMVQQRVRLRCLLFPGVCKWRLAFTTCCNWGSSLTQNCWPHYLGLPSHLDGGRSSRQSRKKALELDMGSDLLGAASPSLPYISLEQISLIPRAFLSHAPSLLNRMFLPSSDMPLSPISFPWFLASFCLVFHPFFLLIASSIINFPMARVAVINFINIPLHFLISLPIK